jgi:hypothetical protein
LSVLVRNFIWSGVNPFFGGTYPVLMTDPGTGAEMGMGGGNSTVEEEPPKKEGRWSVPEPERDDRPETVSVV